MDPAEKFLAENANRDRLGVQRAGQALPGQSATIGASPLDRRDPPGAATKKFGVPDAARQRAQSQKLRGGY
jgi:hypothetical protein